MPAPMRTCAKRALDFSFVVETTHRPLRDHLDTLFAGLPDADAGAAAVYRCRLDASDPPSMTVETPEGPLAADTRPARGIDLLVRHVNATALHEPGDCLIVHAGAVAHDGRAILLPGRSGAGKTSLVTALLAAGFDYLSDEAAVLRPDGRIWPYPKPLSISRGAQEAFRALAPTAPGLPDLTEGDWQVSADRVGGPHVWAEPAAPTAVVAFTFEAGGRLRLEPLPRARALLALLDGGVFPGTSGRDALHGLGEVVARCGTWSLTHPDARRAAAALQEACRSGALFSA